MEPANMTIEFDNHPVVQTQSKPGLAEIEKVLETCGRLSSYQMYRLNRKIASMLEDPELVDRIKSQLSPGDEIEYFSVEDNRDVRAILLKHNRTYDSISNLENGEN